MKKIKQPLIFLRRLLTKNPGDGETTFWYGQAMLAQNYNGISTTESIQNAKDLFQKSLQAKGNDPWLLIGMSHIQSLEGADVNAVKQNLEVAITLYAQYKRKIQRQTESRYH